MKRILEFNQFVGQILNEEMNQHLANAKNWTNLESLKKATGLNEDEVIKGLANLASGKTKNALTQNDIKVMQAFADRDQKFTKPDGGYGKGTVEAIKNWQKALGIPKQDGIWGPNTAAYTFKGDGKVKGPLTSLIVSLNAKIVKALGDKIKGTAVNALLHNYASGMASSGEMPKASEDVKKAFKVLLLGFTGATEDEDAIYSVFEKGDMQFIKTKEQFEELEKFWDAFKISKININQREAYWKPKTIEQIWEITKNNVDSKANPLLTFRGIFKRYFDREELQKMNEIIPQGAEKFTF